MKISIARTFTRLSAGLLLVFMAFCQGNATAQDVNTLTFRFPGKNFQKVYLASFYGETTNRIDSGLTRMDGSIGFSFPKTRASGMYRCIFGKSITDFIYNKEDVVMIVNADDPKSRPDVVSSLENQVFIDFLKKDIEFRKKLDALSVTASAFPADDKFYKTAEKEYYALQDARASLINDQISKNKNSYVARVLAVYREPILRFNWTDDERKTYFKDHYFEMLHVDDTAILRTSLYPNKIIQYLMLYSDPNKPKEANEKAFVQGLDKVLSNCRKDSLVFEFLLSYLVEGFEHYGFDAVVDHLYDTYLSDRSCSYNDRLGKISGRIEADRKLGKGTKAPEWSGTDLSGKTFSSANSSQDYTLMVFWASWCPHCAQLIPQIQSMTAGVNPLKLQIITISMDTSLIAWKGFVQKLKVPWLQSCDGLGWKGKIPMDFNVYATPTMILMDRQRKIISRPITQAQLRQALNEISLIQ
ncbi:MAG: TlpA disulfide reductase family protein [Bacteroidota bacterium]